MSGVDSIIFNNTLTAARSSAIGSGGIAVSGLDFQASQIFGMTIAATGSSQLTIGAGGINIDTTSLIQISAQVTLSANQNWDIGTGGTLRYSGPLTTGANTLSITGAGSLNLRGVITLGSTVTIDTNISADSATGEITLGGANAFDSLAISRGVVSGATIGDFGIASNFGDGGASTAINIGTNAVAGTFNYTGNTASSNRTFNRTGVITVGGVTNGIINVTTAGQTLTLQGDLASGSGSTNGGWQFGGAGNLTLQGVIAEQAGTGDTYVRKADAGTVTVEAANLYEGGTTVDGGTLLVNNTTGSGLGAGNVVVNAGKIGGTGSFTGAVTVNSGGTLAPGASIETLGSGTLTQNSGSTFDYEVNSGVALSVGADLQKVSGDLNLNGTVTLSFTDLNLTPTAFAAGTKFTLINYSGAWNNGLFTYNAAAIADGGTFTAGLNTWELDYNAATGGSNFSGEQLFANYVTVTVVPEPTTFLLLAVGGLATMVFRRRRA